MGKNNKRRDRETREMLKELLNLLYEAARDMIHLLLSSILALIADAEPDRPAHFGI